MPATNTVLLCVIDGLRPDAIALAETPYLDHLMAQSVVSLSARTVMPSVTLPCHMSLFSGVEPGRHGVTTNIYTPPARPVPDLFHVARQAGLTTASFYNWEELRDLSRPGTLHTAICLDNCHDPAGAGDRELAALAANRLRSHPANLSFLYLGYLDTAGHDHGWMSAPYLEGLANASACLNYVASVLPADAAILVTADHGGHARSHGTEAEEDMRIPLILRMPGLAPGSVIEGEVSILDIAPTVAGLLGLARPAEWVGRDLLASGSVG